jgi:hypothetical protein
MFAIFERTDTATRDAQSLTNKLQTRKLLTNASSYCKRLATFAFLNRAIEICEAGSLNLSVAQQLQPYKDKHMNTVPNLV